MSGAYDMTDHVVGPESYAWHLRKMYGNKDRYVTISNPSQGIQKYATVVEYLDNNDLLSDFTHCIVQLTHEPRTVYMGQSETAFYDSLESHIKSEEMFVDGNNIQTNPSFAAISGVERYMFEKYGNMFSKKIETGGLLNKCINVDMTDEFLEFLELSIPSLTQSYVAYATLTISYTYIKSVMEKNNIKFSVFDWWGKDSYHMSSLLNYIGDESIFPDMTPVSRILTDKCLWERDKQSPLKHLNAKQSRHVGEALKEYLDNVEFF